MSYQKTYRNALKETRLILLAWVFFAVWVVGYSSYAAYAAVEEEVSTIWGMPRWVFWGVFAPWMAANLFTVWFCFFYLADDSLEEEPPSRPG